MKKMVYSTRSLLLLVVLSLCLPTAAESRRKKAKKEVAPAVATKVPETVDVTPRARATQLYKQANKLVKQGTSMATEAKRLCLDALARYRQAYGLFPSFKIDLNIGGTLDAMGKSTEAALYFEKFLAKADKVPPKVMAAARGRLSELRTRLSSLKVDASEAGGAVLINGKEVGVTPMALPHYITPGTYILAVQKDGFITRQQKLVLKAGDHLTPRQALTSRAEVDAARRLKEEMERFRQNKTLWGYTAMGGAAALAVGAAVLYGVGASQGISAHDGYLSTDSMADQRAYADKVSSAKDLLIGGHVLLGLAVVTAGVSTWQLLTRPDAEESAPASSAVTAAGISPITGGASVTLGGHF